MKLDMRNSRWPRRVRWLACLASVALSGCVFGYYEPAPDGYSGDFVLASAATIASCDIGPGVWSGSTPALCIYPGESEGSVLPAGTPVKVLHGFVREGTDVSLRVGSGAQSTTVHTLHWEQVKAILTRPTPEIHRQTP